MTPEPPPIAARALLDEVAWIRALARGIAKDDASADDLVQETFVAALRRPPEPGTPLRAWVRRVLGNRVRSEGRRLRPESCQSEGSSPDVPPDLLVERAELHRLLVEAVLALSEPVRSTVLLRYFEGLSASEVARRRGEALGTVTSRLARAHAELRTRLERQYGSASSALAVFLVDLPRAGSVGPAAAAKAGAGAPTATTLLSGVLMSTTAKLALSVALVTSAVLGVTWSARREPMMARPNVQAAPVAALQSGRGEDAGRAETDLASGARQSAPRARTSVPEVEAGKPNVDVNAVLVAAKLIDEHGAGIAGARIELARREGGSVSTPSGKDGRAKLEMSVHREGGLFALRMAAEGRASNIEWTKVSPEEQLFLGVFTLVPAAVVAGRVLDEDGHPLCSASVWVTEAGSLPDPAISRWSGIDTRRALRTSTDNQGGFSFDDVEPGARRVWTHVEGRPWTHSETLHLEPNRLVSAVELTIGSYSQNEFVSGTVVDPSGRALGDVTLNATLRNGRTFSSPGVPLGEDGSFSLLVPEGFVASVDVTDPEGRFDAFRRERLVGGAHGVELRLSAARPFHVIVLDRDDRPVERFSVRTYKPSAEEQIRTLGRGPEEVRWHEGGMKSIARPPHAFQVEVLAPGFQRAGCGPFEPTDGIESVVIYLDRLAGIHGTVTAAGSPLRGVTVSLYEQLNGFAMEQDFFPVRFYPTPIEIVQTDERGCFLLTPRDVWTYHVIAEYEGFAIAEAGPLSIDPHRAIDDLSIEMVVGGILDGRVLLPPGEELEGILVGASRGDARPRVARTNAAGRFSFVALTPGEWMMKRLKLDPTRKDGATFFLSFYIEGEGRVRQVADQTVRVLNRQTTEVSLDLHGRDFAILRGRLTVEGIDTKRWTIDSARIDGSEIFAPPSNITLGEGGCFEVEFGEPGAWALYFRSPFDKGQTAVLETKVELGPGTQAWALDLSTGTVILDVPESLVGQELEWRLSSTLTTGSVYRRSFDPTRGVPTVLGSVPAGDLLVTWSESTSTEVEGSLRSVLEPGGSVELEP